MFDLRYHVASLAAVFFALVIGILVGVALASRRPREHRAEPPEEDLRRAESQSESLNTTVDALTKRGKSEHAYVEATYKNVMANRSKGKKIALLFVGSADSHMRAFVARALADAGAGQPLRIRALSVPIDATKLEQRLAKHPALAEYQGVDQLKNLGHALGQGFVVGTESAAVERAAEPDRRGNGRACQASGRRRRDRADRRTAERSDRLVSSRGSMRVSRTPASPLSAPSRARMTRR